MENQNVTESWVKLKKISLMKLSLIFSFFGLLSGFITGFVFFISVEALLAGWGMDSIPTFGLIMLSFLILPLVTGILFWISGLISGLLINLFLRVIKGLDMYYEEHN
jgi:hypothetical protein